jgi:hypothetical protein
MKNICIVICYLLWIAATFLLSMTLIGLFVTLSDDWYEMGGKLIDKY